MLGIFTALYCEAKLVIDAYALKRKEENSYGQVFMSKDENLALFVTGPGKLAAAMSATYFLSQYPSISYCINLGSCMGKPDMIGRLYKVNKLIDYSSRRTYFPDMAKAYDYEASLVTCDRALSKEPAGDFEYEDTVIYDLEGSGFYQAFIHNMMQNQLIFLKLVTDSDSKLDQDQLLALFKAKEDEIRGIIDEVLSEQNRLACLESEEDIKKEKIENLLLDLAQGLKISVSMQHELRQYLIYASIKAWPFIDDLKTEFWERVSSCKNKNEGKKIFSDLKAYLLELDENPPKAKPQTLKEVPSETGLEVQLKAQSQNQLQVPLQDSKEGDMSYKKRFSHIYIERQVADEPLTRQILDKYKDSCLVFINNYKEIFSRRNQDLSWQKRNPALILAKKEGNLIQKGACVCQSFDNENFYYQSMIMNCMYDCQYCYLKGMYNSAHIVAFVNQEEVFAKVKERLKSEKMYICVSYDTDMLGLEWLTSYTARWIEFAAKEENLLIEIRTKCAPTSLFESFIPCDRVIFSFTLSPEKVIREYEIGAASLEARLRAIQYAHKAGFKVRIAIDPVINVSGWEELYCDMIDQIFSKIDKEWLLDLSLGTFRISQSYLKKMRAIDLNSPLSQYPYRLTEGYYYYPQELRGQMQTLLLKKLENYLPYGKIYQDEFAL